MIDDLARNPSCVLVTGASGFVGGHLCRMLSEAGWSVLASSRKQPTVATCRGTTNVCLSESSDSPAWQGALESVRCVVHLAARVHIMDSSKAFAEAFRETNVGGSLRVAREAARAGVRRFIFLSSIKVNGEGGSIQPYSAEDPPHPVDSYGMSKLEAELMLGELCRAEGMELVIIRPPLIYGPGVRANFHRLLRIAEIGLPLPLGSVDNRRSLIGIWNLVSFIELCMTHPRAPEKTWLISDGDDLSTPELFRRLTRLFNNPDRLFALPPIWLRRIANIIGMGAEINRLCDSLLVDSTPARDSLSWRPPMSVNEGLARTVEAYRAARHI